MYNAASINDMIKLERHTLSDRDLFTSPEFIQHLENLVAVQTGRTKAAERVKVSVEYAVESDLTAYTNGHGITINVGSVLVTSYLARENRYMAILGYATHELGHLLYSDFKIMEIYQKAILSSDGLLYLPSPAHPIHEKHLDEMLAFLDEDKRNRAALCRVAKLLLNIIEDGYIERKLMLEYPGKLGRSLGFINNKAKEQSYSVSDRVRFESEKGAHPWESFIGMIIYYIMSGGQIKLGGALETDPHVQSLLLVEDEIALGIAEGTPMRRIITVNAIMMKLWPILHDYLREITDKAKDKDDASFSDFLDALIQAIMTMLGMAGTTQAEPTLENTDVESIMTNIATRRVGIKVESELRQDIENDAQSINLPEIHDDISLKVSRVDEITPIMTARYAAEAPPLLALSKRLQAAVRQELSDITTGSRDDRLYSGRLNARELYRDDGRVFYKIRAPSEPPLLCAMVLVDESLSMGIDEKIDQARRSAFLLYDFCKGLGIPVMVYGHSTVGSDVVMRSYCEPGSIDDQDGRRLMAIGTIGANRDGMALRYGYERLVKISADQYIAFIISDGRPEHFGYNGDRAKDDLRDAIRQYEKKRVSTIALAIGNDKDVIKDIYGNGFLNITSMASMPKHMTSILRERLLSA